MSAKNNLGLSWREGFSTEALVEELRPVTKVVSSLVFHQTPLVEKQRILNNMNHTLEPGGQLHLADNGLQRSTTRRLLFRYTVQAMCTALTIRSRMQSACYPN